MSKSEKFRKAAKVCWILGAFFTWSMLKGMMPAGMDQSVSAVVALAASLGIQYLLTLVESTIIEGFLPAPWDLDFKGNMTKSMLAFFAYGCFGLDVYLNYGGIRPYAGQLGMATAFVIGITLFLSALFALGSEMLESLADQYEGGRPMQESRKPKYQEPQKKQEQRGPDNRGEKLTNEEVLKQLSERRTSK